MKNAAKEERRALYLLVALKVGNAQNAAVIFVSNILTLHPTTPSSLIWSEENPLVSLIFEFMLVKTLTKENTHHYVYSHLRYVVHSHRQTKEEQILLSSCVHNILSNML